ncbi:8870_t:CDS:1, partial [Rhizophagus irregularis]
KSIQTFLIQTPISNTKNQRLMWIIVQPSISPSNSVTSLKLNILIASLTMNLPHLLNIDITVPYVSNATSND